MIGQITFTFQTRRVLAELNEDLTWVCEDKIAEEILNQFFRDRSPYSPSDLFFKADQLSKAALYFGGEVTIPQKPFDYPPDALF
jgi:hypothetical protein